MLVFKKQLLYRGSTMITHRTTMFRSFLITLGVFGVFGVLAAPLAQAQFQFPGQPAQSQTPTPGSTTPDTTDTTSDEAETPTTDTSTDETAQPADDAAATENQEKTYETGGQGECAGVKTDYFACEGDGAEAIAGLMTQIMMIMTIGVGIIATGGLVYAGVLYASAQDNQEQLKKSRGVVRNVVVGLLLYVFMIAIVDWLVPGGIFETPAPATEQSDQESADTTTDTDAATDEAADDAATDTTQDTTPQTPTSGTGTNTSPTPPSSGNWWNR